MTACVIIPAAGSGARFGGERPKQFLDCAGRPVLAWSLAAFAGLCEQAVVAVNDAWRDEAEAIARAAPLPVTVVAGGAERQESVRLALAAVAPACSRILVHDAVRPCVPRACIAACLAALDRHHAALVAVPCAATVKRADAGRLVAETVPRAGLWLAQTPQGFRRAAGNDAFARCAAAGWQVTDDAEVLERAGYRVELVPGDARNLKITTPDDLALAAALLAAAR
ncbi:MAG: 2-C-methyl-D-erythritol 4-phosphate cytidylyltransferase [Planctomycetes bacterium]|nr:2-C-methyl-D-erythritol 4-phosphate cytidylyltransferase [Planctomycetota bacterium]